MSDVTDNVKTRRAVDPYFVRRILGIALVAFAASLLSYFFAPALLSRWIEFEIFVATGSRIEIEGLRVGPTIYANAVRYTGNLGERPEAVVHRIDINPDWISLLSGKPSFAAIRVETIEAKWNSALKRRIRSIITSPSSGTDFRIGALTVDTFLCHSTAGTWLGSAVIDELSPAGIGSFFASVQLENGLLEGKLLAGNLPDGNLDLILAGRRPDAIPSLNPNLRAYLIEVDAESWAVRASYRGRPPISAGKSLPGFLHGFDFIDSMTVDAVLVSSTGETAVSIFVVGDGNTRRASLAASATGRGSMDAVVDFADSIVGVAATVRGGGGTFALTEGRIEAHLGTGDTLPVFPGSEILARKIRWNGRSFDKLHAIVSGDADAGYVFTLNLDDLRSQGRVVPREGEIRDFIINDIPVTLSWNSGFTRANCTISDVPLSVIRKSLPSRMRRSSDHISVDGSGSLDLVWSRKGTLTGSVGVKIARFSDPRMHVTVEGLDAALPVNLEIKDPTTVIVPENEVWPDLPVNVRINRLAIADLEIGSIEARSIFSHYVLRFDRIRALLLDGEAASWMWIDPFREASGRTRISFGTRLEKIGLPNIYRAFIGSGPESDDLEGAIDVELETGWSDTECLELTGSLKSRGAGKIGTEVIRALARMLPPERRPLDVAMSLIGDYHFNSLTLSLSRNPALGDIIAIVNIKSPQRKQAGAPPQSYARNIRPWIEDLRLELPLLTLIEGLPSETKSELTRKRNAG